jgi:hypothetical protein
MPVKESAPVNKETMKVSVTHGVNEGNRVSGFLNFGAKVLIYGSRM